MSFPSHLIPNSVIILILVLLLFFAIVPPLFFGLGIYRLKKKRYRNSSFIATCAIFALISAFGLIGANDGNTGEALIFVTLPFSLLGLLTGSLYASAAVGLIASWFSIFGFVTSIQNRFGDEPLKINV